MGKKFTVLKAGVDSSGDDILITGVRWNKDKAMRVLLHFNQFEPVGVVSDIEVNNNEISIKCETVKNIENLYPAIGFRVIEKEEVDGVCVYKQIELLSVGVSEKPNSDDRIKPID
jgi:hypothetical protein